MEEEKTTFRCKSGSDLLCFPPPYILKILPPFKNGKVNLFKKNG